jgi:hypothetical protein
VRSIIGWKVQVDGTTCILVMKELKTFLYHCTCPHSVHQFGLPPAKKYSNCYILIMSGEVYGSKLYWMKFNQ